MSGPARILVQVFDGDTIVHEFRRATAQPTTAGMQRLAENAQGWLQAWGSQVTGDQWAMEAERARHAQAQPGNHPE